jgi:hypothetical protein
VPAPDLEVVRVVRRRDLHDAGAELGLRVVVGDHRDGAADDGQRHRPADEVAVALVRGVHRDGHVAEQRLGARGRDRDAPRRRRRRAGS